MDTDGLPAGAFTPVTKWSVRVEDAAARSPPCSTAPSRSPRRGRPGPVHVEIPLSTLQTDPIEVAAGRLCAGRLSGRRRTQRAIDGADRADRCALGRSRSSSGKNAWWPAVSTQSRPAGGAARRARRPQLGRPRGDADGPSALDRRLSGRGRQPSGGVSGGRGGRPGPRDRRARRHGDRRATGRTSSGTGCCSSMPPMRRTTRWPSPHHRSPRSPWRSGALAEECRRARRGRGDPRALRAAHARCSSAGSTSSWTRYRDRRPWHIGVALDALARRMTPDILVVSDVSQVKLWTPMQIPAFNPESHLQPGSWGAMGYAVPGVLAAGLVCARTRRSSA